jgi:predicted PurR-regulated permease PerM
MKPESVNRFVLLLVVIFISAVFLSMIRSFLMAIFMAGIFSALAQPIYLSFVRWYRGRRHLASITTLLLIVLVVILPLGGLIGIITAQEIKVGQSVTPWVQKQIAEPGAFGALLEDIPLYDRIAPYQETILRKAGEMVGGVSSFLINSLSTATVGTVNMLFMIFVMLYTMFFFFIDGASSVFWGAIMAVLSIIPGIGTALVWGPAAIILAASGSIAKGAGLAVFCAVVVGSVDNLLRPVLVGKDTQMHELMIFFGTLGGIVMFGVMGIIIGPIVAALFVTIWDIYGAAFADILPDVGRILKTSRSDKAESSDLPPEKDSEN